jgi:hypothetical protein
VIALWGNRCNRNRDILIFLGFRRDNLRDRIRFKGGKKRHGRGWGVPKVPEIGYKSLKVGSVRIRKVLERHWNKEYASQNISSVRMITA